MFALPNLSIQQLLKYFKLQPFPSPGSPASFLLFKLRFNATDKECVPYISDGELRKENLDVTYM